MLSSASSISNTVNYHSIDYPISYDTDDFSKVIKVFACDFAHMGKNI